jgi:hypothetical protein
MPDLTFDPLDEEDARDGRGDSHERMQSLLGGIHLQNPIRLQSPFYIEGANRPKEKRENGTSGIDVPAAAAAAIAASDASPVEVAATQAGIGAPLTDEESLREDTVILVAIRERPKLDIAAEGLAAEDSQDNDGTHEHMHRLMGGIHLNSSLSHGPVPMATPTPAPMQEPQPQSQPQSQSQPLPDLPPGALEEEWEETEGETPDHSEHMHRLYGSIYLLRESRVAPLAEVRAQLAAELGERRPRAEHLQESGQVPVDDRALTRQVQPDFGDAELVSVVQQQVPGELVDVLGAQLARHRRRLAVEQQAAEDEIRVRAADVRTAREDRPARDLPARQRAKRAEYPLREPQLRRDVVHRVARDGRDEILEGDPRIHYPRVHHSRTRIG